MPIQADRSFLRDSSGSLATGVGFTIVAAEVWQPTSGTPRRSREELVTQSPFPLVPRSPSSALSPFFGGGFPY